jgi:RNA polymerase sigma-70 factor, ECF subfamily
VHEPKESSLEQTRALNRFLAAIERRAFRMAELATGSREDALDLVQDAMLGLCKTYADRDEQEWAPLFYRILQSRINDWYRRTKVRNRFRVWLGLTRPGDDQLDDPVQTATDHFRPGTVERLQQEGAMLALQTALEALPMRQRQVFMLRSWEGLNVADTAYAMGCSEGSVKTHYSRAVHHLREVLGEHWP